MKRFVLLAAVAALASSGALWAAGLSLPGSLPKPTAEITRFQVDSITLRDVTFLFDLAVKNPYPLALSFKGMSLAFSVEGAQVFTVDNKGGFSVPAKGQKTSTFTVTLSYEAIMKLVSDYAARDWLSTVINGTLVIPLPSIPGLPKDISFSYRLEKKIPAVKPQVAVRDFTVTAPSAEQVKAAVVKAGKNTDPGKALGVFKDILAGKTPAAPVIDPASIDVPLTVSFTLEVGNQTRAPLGFSALSYELLVNGTSLITGEAANIRKEGGMNLATITTTFSSSKLTQGVKDVFVKKSGSFTVKGSASIKLPDEIRKEPIPLTFSESGGFTLK